MTEESDKLLQTLTKQELEEVVWTQDQLVKILIGCALLSNTTEIFQRRMTEFLQERMHSLTKEPNFISENFSEFMRNQLLQAIKIINREMQIED